MSTSKNRAVFGILFLVCIFFVILMILASYTMSSFKTEMSDLSEGSNKDSSIAVIEVNGVILESKKIVELLTRAEKDDDIEAIILRINSPGGAVGPTQEIYEEIRRIDSAYDPDAKKEDKKKSKKKKDKEDHIPKTFGKPIYASMGAIAASGGYYLSAATRKIYANPGTLTGSIGVIMQFANLSRLYEWAKMEPYNIKSGRFKDTGSDQRQMSPEEKDMMESMIARVHKQFVRDILRLRKDKIVGDINELAQGQIFSGEDAHKYGLVDEMGSLWAAGRQIHEELGLKGEFGLRFIKKKKKMNFLEFVENLEESVSKIKPNTMFNDSPVLMFK